MYLSVNFTFSIKVPSY